MPGLAEQQLNTETARLALLQKRDGKEAALAWARRTVKAYQEAVENPHHFASSRDYRALYEASIEALRTLVEKLESGASLEEHKG